MTWRPAVIAVVHRSDRKWDGIDNGINTNAASDESGGAGRLSRSVNQLEKSPKSSSGESSHNDL